MTDYQSVDVAIIGGGMVGACLALLLARAMPERRFLLLEARPLQDSPEALPSFDARSTALSPGSMAVMQRLQLWNGLQAGLTAIREIRVTDKGYPGVMRMGPDDNQGHPLGYVVENHHLGRALSKALEGVDNLRLHTPITVTRIAPLPGLTQLTLTNGETVSCQLAVVADGADSSLRQQLGIPQEVVPYDQTALVTNVNCSRPHRGIAHERFTRDGPLALLPHGGDGSSCSALVWAWPAERLPELRGMSDTDLLQRLQSTFGYRQGRFVRLGERHLYSLSLRWAREQVRSGIVLMGNAAHFLHPVAGQGFNLSLRDCTRLTEILAGAKHGNLGDLDTLLAYQRAQESDQNRTVWLSHSFNRLFQSPDRRFGLLRSLGFLGLEFSGLLRQQFIEQMAGRGQRQAQPWV